MSKLADAERSPTSPPGTDLSDGASPAARTGVAFADGSQAREQLRAGDPNPVRDAGPAEMRDEDGDRWDLVDQGSDESFPASDPSCYSIPKR